jgi:hypothetical protein
VARRQGEPFLAATRLRPGAVVGRPRIPRRLLRHKAGLQMGYVAYYLQQNNREEAEPAARGLRETLEAWRRAL